MRTLLDPAVIVSLEKQVAIDAAAAAWEFLERASGLRRKTRGKNPKEP
jgi:hypothetical protein